ncbi:LacI family DNA-binding transcriptional regulator [Marinomonas sp. 15G1-11]|uniref:LacI family DNA-binding transcriptional regulator n=1 Tax=Marinomonas phaeophyticola TaxID=3004091 RepID=A0ABT4JX97_9GAMM|nr:LacI family DNA-binding transcriptional regulator [Marinomonas sp. 15G1-11]MCZ2722908.1 LacI family DNA-binding transcriptional regulator [Marinomonas sp. 15G1-11]
MNKKPSSVDVAKAAGVSQSMVSRAFTPGSSINPEKRELIFSKAKELGYRPNIMARSMITKKSKIIGFVFGYLENQYYPLALEKLSREFQSKGYHSLMFFSDHQSSADEIVQEFLQYQIDAVILASVSLSPDWIEACHSLSVPVVLFNRAIEADDVTSVTSANYEGGKKVANYLVKTGHKRISYISGFVESSTNKDRERGLIDGLKEHQMTLFSIESGNYNQKQAREATLSMFTADKVITPDALFVASDHMAFAVIDTLKYELGLKVPDDVSVIGYDDVPLGSAPSYNLTTMSQPIDDMVALTVKAVLNRIEQPNHPPERIEIPSHLVQRKTVKDRNHP